MTYDTFKSPIGLLYIVEEDEKLLSLGFETPNIHYKRMTTTLSMRVKSWLTDYFNQVDRVIDFDLKLSATNYQQKVYQSLIKVPYGQTITYGELAKKVHSSPRAIGGAIGKNNHLIIIPCHRVVGSKSIGGFSEDLSIKEYLLNLEKR